MDVKRLAEYLCAKYDGVIITAYSDRALIMFDTEAAYDSAVGDKALKGFLHGRAENTENYVFLGIARTMLSLSSVYNACWSDIMYICICTPTTDKQIKEAIASGANTLDALKMELGVCCNCCSCQKSIEEILSPESAHGTP